jgi:hypothetical protein
MYLWGLLAISLSVITTQVAMGQVLIQYMPVVQPIEANILSEGSQAPQFDTSPPPPAPPPPETQPPPPVPPPSEPQPQPLSPPPTEPQPQPQSTDPQPLTPQPPEPPATTAPPLDIFNIKDGICEDDVAKKMLRIYGSNHNLFERCVVEGTYQVFPYTGSLPNQEQLQKMAASSACNSMMTGILLLKLSQCNLGGMPVKAFMETILKISMDIKDGGAVPTPVDFNNMVAKRRDMNIVQESGKSIDTNDQFYQSYTLQLWRAAMESKIQLNDELEIIVKGGSGSKEIQVSNEKNVSDKKNTVSALNDSLKKNVTSDTLANSATCTSFKDNTLMIMLRVTTVMLSLLFVS